MFDRAEGGTWTGIPLPAGSGVVAASSAFDTGFGFGYFQNQHVGATSWFIMAAPGHIWAVGHDPRPVGGHHGLARPAYHSARVAMGRVGHGWAHDFAGAWGVLRDWSRWA